MITTVYGSVRRITWQMVEAINCELALMFWHLFGCDCSTQNSLQFFSEECFKSLSTFDIKGMDRARNSWKTSFWVYCRTDFNTLSVVDVINKKGDLQMFQVCNLFQYRSCRLREVAFVIWEIKYFRLKFENFSACSYELIKRSKVGPKVFLIHRATEDSLKWMKPWSVMQDLRSSLHIILHSYMLTYFFLLWLI